MVSTTPPAPSWELGAGKLTPINEYKWELYDLTKDYSQYNDLAAKMPDKLKELQALFLTESAKYNVFPLDNSGFDVGIDTRTPVDDSYQLPFRFTGKIDKLTFKLGPSQMSAADKKAAEEAYAKVNN